MRFTVSSTALSSRLGILSRVINSKNSIAILDCFLFEVSNGRLEITASDSENVMKTELTLDEMEGEGSFAVNNRTILDAVKELPEQPLTLDVNMDQMTVKVIYQNGMYNFTCQNAEEYPRSQQMGDEAATLQISEKALLDNISRSIFAVANEQLRLVMNGIYMDLTPESLNIVATDGRKLVRNKLFSLKSDTPRSFILQKKPATLLKNVLTKEETDVIIRFDDRNAEITFGHTMLACRLIDGRYPNYASVIPEDNPYELCIDRKALIGALRRVLPFASESSQQVRLRIGTGKIEVSSEDIDFATSAKEEVSCSYEGTPMSIGFMGTSLVEILGNLESDEVLMQFADPSRPCIIIPSEQPEGEEVLMLLMPMLLND